MAALVLYQRRNLEFAQDLQTGLKLFGLFQLGAARADQVKTTSVAVLLDHVASDLNVAVLNQTVRSAKETVQAAILVQRLNTIIQATNHVMATRGLTTTEDYTHVEGFLGRHGRIIAFKGQLGHAIGGGKQRLPSIARTGHLRVTGSLGL